MRGLPKGWAKVPLGTFATRTANIDPAAHAGTEFALYSVPAYARGMPDLVAGADIGSTKQVVRPDDVLLCKIIPHLNRVWRVPEHPSHQQIASPEWLVYRDHGCVPDYLRAALSEQSFRDQFLQTKSGVGGSLTRARTDLVNNIEIPIAPLAEQRRIVTKVDGLTARTVRARKELDRIPALVARCRKRLLALASDGLLTKNWRDEAGGFPWVSTSVAGISETSFDGPFGSNLKSADYVESGIRVVRLENIGSLRFIREKETFISEEKFETLRRHELKADDVMFSSFIAEEIRVCLMPEDLETAAINKADCFCVRVDASKCLPKFLAFRLASPATYQVLKDAVHGATRPRISLSHLKQFEFDLPPLEEQAEIVRRIESAFGWLDRVAADHAAAARLLPKLDAAILAKAFRGEIVPQDPNDEPASVLLERLSVEREAQGRPTRLRRSPPRDRTRDPSPLPGPTKADRPMPRAKGRNMPKSRKDDDVMGKPYLAAKLKRIPSRSVQDLFRAADLDVADFYKQLAWEIDRGHIVDDAEQLRAA